MVSKNRPGALLARIEQAILEAPNIAQEHKDYLETFVWVTNAFANNGSILVMLDDALERGDWAAINRAFSSLQTTQERDSLNIGSLRSMQDAWRDKFAGNAHLSLLGVLDHMEENFLDETYAKLVPVVQSSGVGKSRLMDEISRMRLGICYTFRLQGQTGFPPGDREIADFVLSSVLPNTSEHSCIVALLSATVEQIYKRAEIFSAEHGGSTDGFVFEFHENMAPVPYEATPPPLDAKEVTMAVDSAIASVRSDFRVEFCTAVVTRAKALQKKFENDGTWMQILRDKLKIWDKMASHNLFLKYLLRPLETLIKAVHVNHDERVPLIFTFDEVSNLVVKQNDQAYVALRRVLRCLRSLPVWSFFLSTQLALAYIAPATVEDPSARIKKRTSKRLAPFFSFPMDVGINHEMRYNLDQVMKKPLRDFSSARHMALFGRILWRGYQGESCTTIRELALAKLLSQTEFDVGDRDHVFAVLANRICLDPCVTNRQTAELAETAVNSHLRVILEMDSDNGLSRTTTISEPIVAEAVAYLLNPKKPIVGESSRWSEVLRTLITRLLTPGLIDKGRTGELTMRILATLAKDRLLASGNAADQEFGFSKVFSVASFLRRLLNPVFADMVLKSEARLGSRLLSRLGEEVLPSCEKAFEAGLMNFTHFVATEKEMLPEDMPELLHGLMLHQAALQLGANQSAWDILIPIYNGDPAAPFDRTKLSAILIQVKNRVKPEAWTVNKEKYDSLFPDNPILSIIVELGVTYSSIDMLETFRKDHFSYRINGMGSTTYACWDPQLDPLLRQLLNIKWSPAKEMEKQVSDLTVNFRQHAWVLRYPGYADGQENVGAEGMKRKALGEDEEGREKKEKDAEVKEVKKQKKEKAKRQKQK